MRRRPTALSGFRWNSALVDAVARTDTPRPDWDQAIGGRGPSLLHFWYRQSDAALTGLQFHSDLLIPGEVTQTDPPPVDPGMIGVVLDARGRLISFEAVPARVLAPGAARVTPSPTGGRCSRPPDSTPADCSRPNRSGRGWPPPTADSRGRAAGLTAAAAARRSRGAAREACRLRAPRSMGSAGRRGVRRGTRLEGRSPDCHLRGSRARHVRGLRVAGVAEPVDAAAAIGAARSGSALLHSSSTWRSGSRPRTSCSQASWASSSWRCARRSSTPSSSGPSTWRSNHTCGGSGRDR